MKKYILISLLFFCLAIPVAVQAYSASINGCIKWEKQNYLATKKSLKQTYTLAKSQALVLEKQQLQTAKQQPTAALRKVARAAARQQYQNTINQAYGSYKSAVQNSYSQYLSLRENCVENADLTTK